MKTMQLKNKAAAILIFVMNLVFAAQAWAQDKGIDVNINTKGSSPWYGAWWVWVLGLGLFAIIIVSIISAGKKS